MKYWVQGRAAAIAVAVGLVLAAWGAQPVAAQTHSGYFLTGMAAVALQPDDLINGSGVGVQVGYRFPVGLLIMGEYLYTGKDYYYYDFGGRAWRPAPSYSSIPSRPSSSGDWLFYRTRHVVGGAIGFSTAISKVGIFGALGLMLNIIDLSDAARDYPEFAAVARRSSIGESTALLTTSARAGIVFPADGLVAGQLAYVISLQDDGSGDSSEYVRRNSLIYLGITLQLGQPMAMGGRNE